MQRSYFIFCECLFKQSDRSNMAEQWDGNSEFGVLCSDANGVDGAQCFGWSEKWEKMFNLFLWNPCHTRRLGKRDAETERKEIFEIKEEIERWICSINWENDEDKDGFPKILKMLTFLLWNWQDIRNGFLQRFFFIYLSDILLDIFFDGSHTFSWLFHWFCFLLSTLYTGSSDCETSREREKGINGKTERLIIVNGDRETIRGRGWTGYHFILKILTLKMAAYS